MAEFNNSHIAFITGAGGGIGRETCILLAKRGATVVAVDINKSAAEETVQALPGNNHTSMYCDVASTESVESAISDVKTRYGSPPTIAVNCAGIMRSFPFTDLTEEIYKQIFDVNVKGTIWVTKAVCKELLAEKRKGSIVNIASIAKEGTPLATIHSASKGAVESFSRAAAKEFGSEGIRINTVSPGAIDTPLYQLSGVPQEMIQKYMSINPMKRFGKPDEVAEAIVFLASEQASYITGSNLYVHGGHL